jgi:DeoR family transcriptional regulator, suf operon transcriptional repressor
MSSTAPHSDNDLLDLLRTSGSLSIAEMVVAMEVTATSIRQRLTRLSRKALVQHETIRHGRGRPRHRYSLTERGVRVTGSNFADLALVLWQEVRSFGDGDIPRAVLRRISNALAAGYVHQMRGDTPAERMCSLVNLLVQRRIPASVEQVPQHPAIIAHACPYPTLAETDRSICTMEKMLFSKLLGGEVELTECRLDGGANCRFQTS